MSMAPRVSVTVEGPVGYLEFDHQRRRNAMTVEMWSALPAACAELENDESVRVVVLKGAGEEAFISGADISQFTDEHRPGTDRYNQMVAQAYAAIGNLPKPTIAQVRGYCVGGGLAIACNTDFRIGANDSKFGLPPAGLGVGYSPAGIGALVDLIGPAAVNEMVFTADLIDSATAARWGLINHVVPAAELDDFVNAKARSIAARAPMSQYAAKLAVNAHLSPSDQTRQAAAKAAEACLGSNDYLEGIAAFVEKRPAKFTGS